MRASLSLLLLVAVVWSVGGVDGIARALGRAEPWPVAAAFVVLTLDRVLMAYKWVRLLGGHGIAYPVRRGVGVYCTASLYGTFLPSTLGADLIRAGIVSREGYRLEDIVASIAVERMLGFVAALASGLLGLAILHRMDALDERFDVLWSALGTVVAIGSLVFAASFSRRLFDALHGALPRALARSRVALRLRALHERYVEFHAERAVLARFFLLTLLEQALPILGMAAIARAIGVDAGLLFLVGVVPLTLLVARVPVSIEGLGVFEGVFALLMALGGVPAAEAVAVVVVARIVNVAVLVPWWALHALGTRRDAPRTPLAGRGGGDAD